MIQGSLRGACAFLEVRMAQSKPMKFTIILRCKQNVQKKGFIPKLEDKAITLHRHDKAVIPLLKKALEKLPKNLSMVWPLSVACETDDTEWCNKSRQWKPV